MSADDTRKAILDAAEALIGEVGFDAMSLRVLTSRAGVNLAGVHYHFGSKEDLAKAAMARRIAPVNEERLRRLGALLDDDASPGASHGVAARKPTPRDVVAAFIEPALSLACELGAQPCAMLGRLIAEQPAFLRPFLAEQFGDVLRRFATALVRTIPGLTFDEACWRLFFSVGAMTHTMQHARWMPLLTQTAGGEPDVATTIARVVSFCTAGVSAGTGTAPAPTAPHRARTSKSPTRKVRR